MKKLLLAVLMSMFLAVTAAASPVVLSGVAAYTWTTGCGPTAGAMALSYWDSNGYDNLFAASGAAALLTANVAQEIGQLGQYMGTSVGLADGWTYVSNLASGIVNYTQSVGYSFAATTLDYREFSWLDYTSAIDAGNPVLVSADSDGDWNCDHAVAAFGYDDRGADGLWYGFYTGWSEQESAVRWEPYTWSVFNTAPWGISFATFISPAAILPPSDTGGGSGTVPVPEPASLILFGSGILLLACFKRYFKRSK